MVTEAQYKKAIDAINHQIEVKCIRLQPCPTCGSNEVAHLSEGYVLLALSKRGDQDRDGRALATLPFICPNCGHTTLIDSYTLGVGLDVFGEEK
jgi:predicted RNA-binding Zn-ribbon protein involved in translation (DUF1610 family)